MRPFLCIFLFCCLMGSALGQALTPYVFGSGGGRSESSTLRLWSTAGEAAAADPVPIVLGSGTMQGVGFWFLIRDEIIVGVEPTALPELRNWLGQNHPNPFNPSTTIRFSLANAGPVRLRLYNLKGELVATLVDEVLPAGDQRLIFRPTELSSGVYFYRLETDGFTASRRLLLLK